ncbi:MAG: hypothetical protein Q9190_007914, partial [Brigantiaea leucoxantha]
MRGRRLRQGVFLALISKAFRRLFKRYNCLNRGRVARKLHSHHDWKDVANGPGDSMPGSVCGLEYLQAIGFNLAKMLVLIQLLGGENVGRRTRLFRHIDALCGCWVVTRYELRRLCDHHELFPSSVIREAFFKRIRQDLYILSVLISSQKTWAEQGTRISGMVASRNENTIWPSVETDRKPWQQFLHNLSPAIGVPREMLTADGACVRFLPTVGYTILNLSTWRFTMIKRDLNLVNVGFPFGAGDGLMFWGYQFRNGQWPPQTLAPKVVRHPVIQSEPTLQGLGRYEDSRAFVFPPRLT